MLQVTSEPELNLNAMLELDRHISRAGLQHGPGNIPDRIARCASPQGTNTCLQVPVNVPICR